MEDKFYVFRDKTKNKDVGYAVLDDIPFTVEFLKKTNEIEYLMREDQEAEKALAGEESKYELHWEQKLYKSSKLYSDLKEYKLLLFKLIKYQRIMDENIYDGFKENKFEDSRLVKIKTSDVCSGGLKKNPSEYILSENN
ncbi:MAG: hypothetical protein JSW73_02090 [Candidatus Woesearchaeota archaeon]|nr:MAG: hypothetical protein JSW73_02090 [Candidatus Woesearchaeota archaeon]